jgi:hypothetical protein
LTQGRLNVNECSEWVEVSCQNSLGVGAVVPPIINAFSVSSGLSARETGADISASNIEAPASSAMIRERPTCRLSPTTTPEIG